MTPEEAIALKPGTTPGPWHSVYYEDENREIVPDGIVSEMSDLDEEGYPSGNISVFRSGPANREDGLLAAAAPDMRATIAAMQWEYGVEQDDVTSNPDPSHPGPRRWVQWCASEDYARTAVSAVFRRDRHPRLVRRLVGDVQEVEG